MSTTIQLKEFVAMSAVDLVGYATRSDLKHPVLHFTKNNTAGRWCFQASASEPVHRISCDTTKPNGSLNRALGADTAALQLSHQLRNFMR
jgi:hypothetical protein